MPLVEFEHTIPASEQAKAVHALDRSATVTGGLSHNFTFIPNNYVLFSFAIN
jgi:hypothetical protein